MSAIIAGLTAQAAPMVMSYIGTKLAGRLAQRWWGPLALKFLKFLKWKLTPKKTNAEDLIGRLNELGVPLTPAQRAKLSQSEQDSIDHA